MCSICLDTLVIDKDTTTLRCGHTFHNVCYDTWGARFNNYIPCPNCRYPNRKKYLYTNPPHFDKDTIIRNLLIFYGSIGLILTTLYLLYIK